MFWLRPVFYLLPLALVFGAGTLFHYISELRLPRLSESLTTSIREPVGPLNPFVSVDGITREVRDLVFEPLLLRDDNLNLRPNILADWSEETVITIRCDSEEAAGETEAMLLSGEYLDGDMVLLAIDRFENVITVALEGFAPGLEERLVAQIDPEHLGDYLLVRLDLRHSVRDSLRTFLTDAVERGQVRMVDYEGDETAYLFLKGDTDLFLRELELYYQSNLTLEPSISLVGPQSYTSAHELRLTLRGDVRWHDGISVTTRDLLFSFEELTRPGASLPLGPSFWFVESIDRVDDLRVRVTCRETPSMMMESWEKLPLLPAHVLDLPGDTEIWNRFVETPIGCGPYLLDRRRRDGGVELSRFEGYFRSLPLQPRLVYRRFDSLESKLLALQGEQIDLLVPDQRFVDWSSRNSGVVQQLRCLPRFQHFVAWNLDQAPFDQIEVRRALAEAIDPELLLEESAIEFQEPVESLFFPSSAGGNKAMPLPLYDPRSAERRLTEAGFSYDLQKGVRVDEEGKPFEFPLLVVESSQEHLEFARRIADQWAAVGVTARIEAIPWEEIVTNRLVNREFEAVLLSWELPLERDRFPTWHSSGIEEGGGNLFGLRNQVVDELLVKLRFEQDPTAIENAVQDLEEEIAELQPCLFLAQTGRIVWMRSGAVKTVRNPEAPDPIVAEPGIGKAGLERSRLWWVRSDLLPRERALETMESR